MLSIAKLKDDKQAFSGKWYLVNGLLYITVSEEGTYDFHEAMYKDIIKRQPSVADYPWFWYPRGMCEAMIPEDGIANLAGPSLLTEFQKGVIASEFDATNMPDWISDEHYELSWALNKTSASLKPMAELFFKEQLKLYTGRKLPIFLNKDE